MTTDEPTVVVADDNHQLVETFAGWLDDEYTVRTARDGRQTLDEIDTDVDVVLLDREMPKLSGEDVLDRIRTRGIDCRVAMISAVDPGPDTPDPEPDDYLVKPVLRDDVLSTVEALLARPSRGEEVGERFERAATTATLEVEEDGSAEGGRVPLRARMREFDRDLRRILERVIEDGSAAELIVDDEGAGGVDENRIAMLD